MTAIKNYISRLTLLQVLLVCLLGTSHAADKEFCEDYVLVAISQYWQSVDEECGLTGLRWSANYKGQYEWCLTAHQWVAENETEARDRMLKECRAEEKTSISEEDKGEANDTKNNKRVAEETTNTESKADISHENPLEGRESDALAALNENLLSAVAMNNLQKVKQLVAEGANIHYVTSDMKLIKKYNMAYHHEEGILLSGDVQATLVNSNVEGKSQTVSAKSESLLSYAVSKGLIDVGLWLLEETKVPSLGDDRRQQIKEKLLGNALITAVKSGDSVRVDELLSKQAPVNYELDSNFGTPLYFAVTEGNIQIAKTLLKKGGNAKYSTNGGQNMLNYALENIELLQLLIDHGADPDSNGESANSLTYPIIQAVKRGNSEAVKLLMSKGANAEISDYEVPYPILQAIADQQVKIVEILLNYGVNANVVYNSETSEVCGKDSSNKVPLSEAVRLNNKELITLLKKAGAKTEKEICEDLSIR